MAKFKTLAEYQAHVRHELDHQRAVPELMLDNDMVASMPREDSDEYVYLYESDPYTLLREALTLLGIPHAEV